MYKIFMSVEIRNLRCGFIGCGLATFERAKAFEKDQVVCCLDGYDKIERKFCETFDAVSVDFDTMMTMVDAVFVCTPHQFLYDYSIKALEAGKHVMVEKPGAVTVEELQKLNETAQKKNLVCHVGYTIGNILKSRNYLKDKPHSILGNYCHGARDGYDKEWRMRENSQGGGVSYDLLTHIIHMSLLCDPNLELVGGSKANSYWKSAGEDVAMAILKNNETNAVASLFASCSDWKKNFSFALNLKDCKYEIKNVNARNGDFTFITHSDTGPGKIPETSQQELNGNFWIEDTLLFLNKISENIPTDLSNEIKVLELINRI
jgi:predicted dehydrogenase